jgi:hypothetical protein
VESHVCGLVGSRHIGMGGGVGVYIKIAFT